MRWAGGVRPGPTVLRVGWGVGDQALCSITNLALGVLVARALTPAAFGAFGLALATYLILLGGCRALVAEPLLVRFSAVDAAEWRAATRAATGSALAIGIVGGLGCAVIGVVGRGAFSEALFALGFALPVLLLQDMWRYAFFAAGRGARAFVNDLACAVAVLPALAILTGRTQDVTAFVIVWGLGSSLAALLGAFQARLVPAPHAAVRWLRTQRDLGVPFLGEFAAVAMGELALFGVAGLVGLAAVGALRAGQILLGPLRVLFMGVRLVAIPDGVRLLNTPGSRPRQAAGLLSATLAVIALAWGGVLMLLPAPVGEALLGSSWSEARSVILPLSLAMAGTGAVTGAFVGLRALAAAWRSLWSRVLVAPFMIVGTLAGAAAWGAPGAALGSAVVIWLSAVLWWWQFLMALDERSDYPVATRSSRLLALIGRRAPV